MDTSLLASPDLSTDLSTHSAARVIRASALYDLVVTVGFALPFTAALALSSMGDLHRALGLSGVVPVVDDPFTMLLANLLGSIVSVWAVLRIFRPVPLLGAADTVARALFSTWFAWALTQGASPVLLGLLVPEVAWGVVQGAVVARALATGRRRTLAPC